MYHWLFSKLCLIHKSQVNTDLICYWCVVPSSLDSTQDFFFFFIGVDRFAYCLVHTPSKSFEQEQRFILCFQSLFLNYFHSLSLTVAPHILVALLPSLGCNDFKNKKKIFLKSLNFYIGFYYFPHLLLCLKPVEEPLGICWTMST